MAGERMGFGAARMVIGATDVHVAMREYLERRMVGRVVVAKVEGQFDGDKLGLAVTFDLSTGPEALSTPDPEEPLTTRGVDRPAGVDPSAPWPR